MKRLISIILCVLLVVSCVTALSTTVSAKESDVAQTGYQIEVTTYDQLKNLLYNSPNGETYVLQNDIIIEDNTNDKTLIVGSFSDCTIDLNGYTLGRTTRGIDNCLIRVNDGAEFVIKDSSKDNSGKMFFRAGNYAGTNAVVFIDGEVDIYGGNFEIKTPYEVGGGVVFLSEQGQLDIYDGVFDSHTAYGGDTIELRHNAYLYDVPHCDIYGGTFYGKFSNFEVSSYSDFTSFGCFYPSVHVYDGEFYIARPDDEYAGFAYCNNGWGQVIVAGGTVFYKCLNKTDEKYIDGVTKNLISVDYEGKTGYYYEVTPPAMISSEELAVSDRLTMRLAKQEVSLYGKNGTVYQQNQEMIDSILTYTDTIEVPAAIEESPLMWVENTDNVKTVSWYMSDEAHYDGKNTPWSELGDYEGSVLPFRFDFRPQEETTLYIRCLITTDDNKEIEDVIAIHYEEFKPNPPVTSVEITSVDAPKVGANPDFTVADTAEYYINGMYWTDVTTSSHVNLKETDVFEAGHKYQLEVWLRANDGYKFKVDSDDWVDIAATVGGKEAETVGNEIAVILTVSYELQNNILLGDADGDGSITVMDATAIQRDCALLELLDEQGKACADVDKDGKVSVMDATVIQRFMAQLIPGF